MYSTMYSSYIIQVVGVSCLANYLCEVLWLYVHFAHISVSVYVQWKQWSTHWQSHIPTSFSHYS